MRIWLFNHYASVRAQHFGKRWARCGHHVTIFAARNHHLIGEPLPPVSVIDGVEHVSLPARPYRGNGVGRLLNMADYCRAMATMRRSDKPDAIIASSPHPFCIFPARRLAQKYKAKLVFEVRDLWPLSLTEVAGVSPKHPMVALTAYAERYAYRHADAVVSLLGGAEPHMLYKGLAPGKFIHIPNGIDLDAPHPSPPESEEGKRAQRWMAEQKDAGRKILIHPGAQGVPNALDRLVEAMRHLRDEPVTALLVGRGSETEKLKEAARGLAVQFFPPVPKNDALWLTANADIGYSGGRQLPIYRFGSSLNKVTDFVRFGLPFVEVIPSGMGVLTDGDSPDAIAEAIRDTMSGKGVDVSRFRKRLDYDFLAERYLAALA